MEALGRLLKPCVVLVVCGPCCCILTPQAGDSAPDVWLQLLERCARISSCQPALIRDLGLQLVEQQQLVSSLQQQCAGQEQQMSLQQATNSLLQQQGVELHGRVAALEGQLAQLLEALQHRG